MTCQRIELGFNPLGKGSELLAVGLEDLGSVGLRSVQRLFHGLQRQSRCEGLMMVSSRVIMTAIMSYPCRCPKAISSSATAESS